MNTQIHLPPLAHRRPSTVRAATRTALFGLVLTTAVGTLAATAAEPGAADRGAVETDAVQPAVAATVYLRTTTASTNLSSDGSPVIIKQVSIPAGTWLVTAKANPVNFGAADYIRCLLLVGGAQKDAGATLLGDAAPGPTGETGPSVAEIVLQTAVTTTVTKKFTLECQHDFATSGEYVDPGASIMIVANPGPLG